MKLFCFLIILFLFNNCSFDNKTGIWKNENEDSKKNSGLLKEFKTISVFKDNFNEQLTKSGGSFEPKAIDEAKERFKCIFELKPKSIYRGCETFSDYFALLFEDTDKVVLESVNYGNAIYIIEGDWKILSRRTKAELKTSNKTKVIHHRSDWFSKLKNYLQIGFE